MLRGRARRIERAGFGHVAVVGGGLFGEGETVGRDQEGGTCGRWPEIRRKHAGMGEETRGCPG